MFRLAGRIPLLLAFAIACDRSPPPPDDPWQFVGNPIAELKLEGTPDWLDGTATLSILCESEDAAAEYLAIRDWAESVLSQDEFWIQFGRGRPSARALRGQEEFFTGARIALSFELSVPTVWYPIGYVHFVSEPQVLDLGEDGAVTFTSGGLREVEWRSADSHGAGAVLAGPQASTMEEINNLLNDVSASTDESVLEYRIERLAREIWDQDYIDLRPNLRADGVTALVATAATANGLRTARFELNGFGEREARCGQPVGSWLP